MEKSPSWEANRFSASQKIPRNLWNPKVHYRNHKRPPPLPIMSQFDPVYVPTSHFLKIHLNIILPSTSGSPKWRLSLRFPHQSLYTPILSAHTCYMPRPSHASRIHYPKNIWWGVQIIKLLIMRFSPFPCCLSLLGPNILFSTLFSDTLSLRFSLIVSDQVLQPNKKTGNF